MSRSVDMHRAPFCIERNGSRIEIVTDIDDRLDRDEITEVELLVLIRDVSDVLSGLLINPLP
jgi:hypothetical protein